MFDVVYYFVPREHMALTKTQEAICGIDIEDWVEVIITDSHSIYENKKWYQVQFFTAKTSEVARLIWSIKGERRELSIRRKLYRFRKQYATETVKNESDLVTRLEELACRNYGYAFLYTQKGEVEIAIYSEGCEDLDMFVKKQCMAEIEKVISAMADKADYFKYEFDQEED